MKIFFVCSWYPNRNKASEGIFLKNMAEAIAAYDDITVFYVTEDASLSVAKEDVHTQENGVSAIVRYHKPFRSGIRNIDTIVNSVKEVLLMWSMVGAEFQKGRPDLFHLNVVTPKIFVLWFYQLFYNIPFVYSEHWDVPIRVRFGLMKKWLPWRVGMKLCSQFASRVIVCSQAMKDCYRYFGLSTNVTIISNVVEVHETDFEDHLRKEGKKVLVHISSLDSAQKNVYGLLEGIARVAATRSDFELHIMGRGAEYEALKEHTAKLGLLDNVVFFRGYVSEEEKKHWIKRSASHVLFSNFEGQSVVTAESICYGRPVIATRCGGPEDFVNEGNGLLIEPRDVDALEKALHNMLDDYAQYNPEALRRYGKDIFSADVVGRMHHQLYEQVLAMG